MRFVDLMTVSLVDSNHTLPASQVIYGVDIRLSSHLVERSSRLPKLLGCFTRSSCRICVSGDMQNK